MAESKSSDGKKRAKIMFLPVNSKNVESVRMLNSVVFPVVYSDRFYQDLVVTPPQFTKMAYYNDVFVGAIGSRVEKTETGKRLYIMTLGVLAPYRRLGIGSQLLESIIAAAKEEGDINEVALHVWTANEEGLNFYKSFGFSIKDTVENYYRRIEPPHAYLVTKTLETEESK